MVLQYSDDVDALVATAVNGDISVLELGLMAITDIFFSVIAVLVNMFKFGIALFLL
jgi:hypothetical protein